MSYPWYSAERQAAPVENAHAAFTIQVNCETMSKRMKFDLLCRELRTKNKFLHFYAESKTSAAAGLQALMLKRADVLNQDHEAVKHALILIDSMPA